MSKTNRRGFLQQTPLLTAAASLVASERLAGRDVPEGQLPTIRLGTAEVSRLLLGSNPFFGFAHKRDGTGKVMREYYTEDRVMTVLDEAAENGINAVWTPCYDRWISLWNRYQDGGGKLPTWVGQPDPKPADMEAAITACVKNGGKAICIQGERIDAQVAAGRWDVVRGWLEHIKSYGIPAGMATHRPTTHLEAEERGMPTDFYHQCVYQPEVYSHENWNLAMRTIDQLEKPVVAYKVLAAGRRPPSEAFPKLWQHLKAKDGLCVGIFQKDQPDQIAENTRLTRQLTKRA